MTLPLQRETGVIIVGIKKKSGKMAFNPDSGSLNEALNTLIVLGESSAITKLENTVACNAAAIAAVERTGSPGYTARRE